MRLHKGFQIGGLLFSNNPGDKENPITIMDVHSQDEWPYDYEDAEEIIRHLRNYIRQGKKYQYDAGAQNG